MKTLDKSNDVLYNVHKVENLQQIPFRKFHLYTGDFEKCLEEHYRKYNKYTTVYSYTSKSLKITYCYFEV